MARMSSALVVTMILLSVATYRVVSPMVDSTPAVGVKAGDWIKYGYTLIDR